MWTEQTDHLTHCYFCLTKIVGHNSKSKHTIVYPNIPSALRPVEHDYSLPIPKPPQQQTLHEEEPTSISPEDKPGPSCSSVDRDFLEWTVPYLKSQSELNHLVTDINLLEIQAELLASHLKGWNLLQQGVKSVIQETIAITAIIFFKDGKAVYCKR